MNIGKAQKLPLEDGVSVVFGSWTKPTARSLYRWRRHEDTRVGLRAARKADEITDRIRRDNAGMNLAARA